ncbi:TIGR03086 family metal-binding protein [Actinopolymorpha pittospori]
MDLVDLNRRAVQRCVELVAGVDAAALERPTPCAGWTLGDLLAHMLAQHRGFAAAADGNGRDRAAWEVRPLGPDPAAEYEAAARRVQASFGADGVLDRECWLPEFSEDSPFPGRMALTFHLVDYVVHGWDVAASLGVEADFSPDLVAAAQRIAEQVPTGSVREEPGAAFGPALPAEPTASPMDALLLHLGRNPSWPKVG